MQKILILGGIKDAVTIAHTLAQRDNLHIIYSLAGRVPQRISYPFEVRSGGFGGAQGLADFCKTNNINIVLNATHPFADRISENLDHVRQQINIPCLRYLRKPWEPAIDDDWTSFSTLEEIAKALPEKSRVFLSIGTLDCAAFVKRHDCWFLGRSITEPSQRYFTEQSTPAGRHLIAPPPYVYKDELKLLRNFNITHLVTKNSGGEGAFQKIQAAKFLRLPVYMLERQFLCPYPVVHDIADAVGRVDGLIGNESGERSERKAHFSFGKIE